MRQLGVVMLAVLLAGCGSQSAPAGKNAPRKDASGPAYSSVEDLGFAINAATSGGLSCRQWNDDSPDQVVIGAAASGSCQSPTNGDQSRVVLYRGDAALKQGVDLIKANNPSTPVFVGRNWLLVANDANKLKGKMPGKLDRNGADYQVN